ncbi:unnamed protein product [Adineta steineri]|uniref:G-protein coupled receptors family 1 profile domain-containing protein n=1 Tax=Adineta steineri TaxID=433720 RepID=A0A814YTX5_9BILA|nr:unnamed protein product [Adineta steineri]CAF1524913.1 unnamed protein product [Adineta steineri]
MSSSGSNTTSSNVDTINALQHSKILFIKVWCFTMISCGFVGHTLSIYVFTRRSLYSNPCARYFLASAMIGMAVVVILVPLRLLQAGYNIDAFVSSAAICGILTWFLNSIKALPSWIIVLACADLFLCSSQSVTIRAWSSIRVVTPAVSLTIVIVGLTYIHVAFYTRLSAAPSCAFLPGTYTIFLGIFNLFLFSMGPPIGMLSFGLLTIRNIRRSVKRVVPNTNLSQTQNETQQRQKATDRQLIQMMIAQFIFYTLTTTPNSVFFIYSSAISNNVANALQTARLSLVSNIVSYITNGGACLSFYLFTLSSKLFRRELMHLFRCQRGTIRPITISRSNRAQKALTIPLSQLNR